jgi:outer membrane immunogenic protein
MRGLLIFAACATVASGALAKEAPSFDWAGTYLGLEGGYGSANTNWSFPFDEYYNTAAGQGFATSPSGGIGGAFVGINRQFGEWVAGLEASVAGAGLTQTLVGPVTPTYAFDQLTTKVQDLETVTGRLGFAKQNWLFYGKGGFGTGDVNLSALSGVPGPGVTANVTKRLYGWTLGAGIEFMATANVVFGVEYDYTNLSGARFTGTTSNSGPFNVDLGNVATSMVLGRVSLKLN